MHRGVCGHTSKNDFLHLGIWEYVTGLEKGLNAMQLWEMSPISLQGYGPVSSGLPCQYWNGFKIHLNIVITDCISKWD